MITTIKKLTAKSVASAAMLSLVLGGFAMNLPATRALAAPGDTHTVTITKFVEGERATSENAQGLSFPMMATWADSMGAGGSGTYALDSGNSYQAMTSEMTEGSSYSTNEDLTGDNVGAACTEGGAPYALMGYTTGTTYEAAVAGTPSMTAPTFTNLVSDQFVIVWNDDCAIPNEPVEPETVQVTILKYVDGERATTESASTTSFNMISSSENADGSAGGGGSYQLNSGNTYQAMTNPMEVGSSYMTNEVIDENVAASCTTDGAPYAFQGYTTGSSVEAAENAATSTGSSITLENIQDDQFIIVWNETCDDSTEGEGSLTVDSVEALDTTGRANGTYEDGWSYRFNLTVPTDEENVAFRFSDWTSGSDILPVANNMRISSDQADNNNATVTITAANVYSADLRMVEDMDSTMPGLQVSVLVEVRIPSGTNNGSYVTSYGVRSTEDTTP